MKNPFRRQKPAEAPAYTSTPPTSPVMVPRMALDPDRREAIDKALDEFPIAVASRGSFYGVPITYFNKEELIQIIAWVSNNARDHRRDS